MDGSIESPAWWDDVPGAVVVAGVDDLNARPDPEVIVVGLGASGLEAIAMLAARGVDVIGLDATGVAAGAAGGNGGFLLGGLAMFHHHAVAAIGRHEAAAWYRCTLTELDRLSGVEPTFRRVGSRRTPADAAEARDIALHLAALRADGLPAESDGVGGLLVPGDGAVQPVARCQRLAREAQSDGALLVGGAPVTSVAAGEVHLTDRVLRAPRILVAIDGGLERVVPDVAQDVTSARLQMLATRPDVTLGLDVPVYHRGGLDYAQQLPDGRVLVGGGRDLDPHASAGGSPRVWARPSEPVQAHLDAWRARLGSTAAVTHRWAAHAAFRPSRMPLDVRVAPGVHVVGAYSGHGNVLGGLLARRAAQELLAQAST